ncbi:hypothetical protein ADK65_32715 [Streptomyces sp. NRRL B-1140]|uniref:DUF5691 domain-containing protein n=1 Tax=Streptomyces sp. NRRL B-1140 TaxID=1415549 RepID=UPI0006AE7D20|nr:DUF5691 domain-containing protein [Streptomyces sp. NRRL B-1140]KOV93489.1 hypothetical protein ADK65_32715 [Streptomyces sp. NRRL B-1140]
MTRTSAPVDAPGANAWEGLVTTALLGTDRRTPPGTAPGPAASTALLDAAAAETVRRRAGLRPARAAERPQPAPPDTRPPLPPAAARRLALLLADRPGPSGGGRRGTAPDLTELLPQWLAVANARGFAPPPQLLPALLDAARGRTDLRPAALEFAGPRALWLARLNPDWRFALRSTPGGGTALPHPEDGDRVRQLWQEGLFAERVALLSALRSREPAAARDLLATTWATERAEDRLMFLDSLRAGLGPDDEPFLEQALADRSRNVRATAAELLSALPGSALAGRMAVRAHACVAIDHVRTPRPLRTITENEGHGGTAPASASTGARPTGHPGPPTGTTELTGLTELTELTGLTGLTGPMGAVGATEAREAMEAAPAIAVEAPHECDPGMERDGVVAKAPAGRGERSWWFGQLVEAAPLSTWSRRLGGRTPREIVALPVADDWQGELHAAWCRAAVRQRDAEWSRALLGDPSAPEAGGPGAVSLAERARLLGTLNAAERTEWVAGFIGTHGLSEAFQLLGVCAVPWGAPLGRAVVDALNIARDAGSYPWSFSGVMGLAERCLDPSEASRLDALLAVPDEPENASPGAGGYWAEAFQRLVTTLRLRAAMAEELGAA